MGMKEAWNALWGREQKESAVGSVIAYNRVGKAQWSNRDYEAFAREAYVQNVVAYACVRKIAKSISAIPIYLMDGDKEVEQHDLLKLLQTPNPFMSYFDFIEAVASYYLIAGNSYIEQVSIGKTPKELYPLRPDRMKPVLGPSGYPVAYIYSVGPAEKRFEIDIIRKQWPILHIKAFHPIDDVFGLSAIEPAAKDIDVHSSSKAFNKSLLDNGAAPSGALIAKGGVGGSPEQFDRLRAELIEKFSGTANAGRPMLLEGDLDWKEMGTSPRDMEFIEGQRQTARDIALAFDVPSMLLGIPGDNTYSNLQEANIAFARQCVVPLAKQIFDRLNSWFAITWPNLRIVGDWDEVPGLAEERRDVWAKLDAATFLTINEKREAAGYEEVEFGDDILVSTALIPLGEEPPEPEPMDPNADPNADPTDEDQAAPLSDTEEEETDTEG